MNCAWSVSDTRGESRPIVVPPTDPDAESGRGLLLVTALADDWGVMDRCGGPGKTIRASLEAGRQQSEPTMADR